MPLNDGVALIDFGFEKDEEDKLFQRWIVGSQYEMSFEEFKRKLAQPVFKPTQEVLDDVAKILDAKR